MKKKISLILLSFLCLSIIGCGKKDSTELAKETVTATPTQEAQKGKITSAPVSDEKEITDIKPRNTESTESTESAENTESTESAENTENTGDSEWADLLQKERFPYTRGGFEEWLGTFVGDNSYTLCVDSAFQFSDDEEGEVYVSYTIEGEDLSYAGIMFASEQSNMSPMMRFHFDSDGVTVTQKSAIEGVPAGTLDGYYKRQ